MDKLLFQRGRHNCRKETYPDDRRHQVVMSEADLEKFADTIIERVRAKHTEFDVDPEQHYNDHRELSDFLKTIREAKSSLRKTILQLAFLGIIALAAIGFWNKS